MEKQFWQQRELESFTTQEWESLCDGCGKCCLNKLEDEESGEVIFTRVACQLLDSDSCRCADYSNRHRLVPACIQVTPAMARSNNRLPASCAYRLLAQGLSLPDWHPLLSGDHQSTVGSGNSVAGRVISEEYVHPDGLDEHVISWVSV